MTKYSNWHADGQQSSATSSEDDTGLSMVKRQRKKEKCNPYILQNKTREKSHGSRESNSGPLVDNDVTTKTSGWKIIFRIFLFEKFFVVFASIPILPHAEQH